ncbi:MAG: hypothetical protein M0029_10315 [Actinomycetota bacterium]|jgi:hypothetical protein|nr:hypothetical protein [Actinomycetota bacterium]
MSPRADARTRQPSLRRAGPVAVIAIVYLGLAAVAYDHVLFSANRLPVCACGDQVQEVWFLRWPVYALGHGRNPLFTTWLNYPHGANLAINTTALLLGVVSAPLQLLIGSVRTFDVLLALALAASALAMCLVLRRWVDTWGAAFAGGLLYGFSPFMIGEGEGHLFLTAAFVPPLVLAVLDDVLVRRQLSARRGGLLLGGLLVIQYFISAEVLVMTVIVAACGVVVLAVANRHEVHDHVRHALVAGAFTVLVVTVVLAYPLWFSVLGPQHVVGPPHALAGLARYPGDLLGPVVPTSLQHVAPAALQASGDKLVGASPSENGLYLGVPLLTVLAALTWRFRRTRPLVFFTTMVVVVFVLALGPTLTVNGHDTHLPLPLAIVRHVPFLQDVMSVRFALFMQLSAAAALAIGLDQWARNRRKLRAVPNRATRPRIDLSSVLIGAVALVPLVPQVPYAGAPTDVPAFWASTAVDRIPAGSAVLTYPYPRGAQRASMLGQVAADMRFKLLGGSVFVPGHDGRSVPGPDLLEPTQVQAIFYNTYAPSPVGPPGDLALYPPVDPGVEANLRTFLTAYHVSTVVVDPIGANPAGVLRYLAATLGPGARMGGVVVWFDVPHLLAAHRSS